MLKKIFASSLVKSTGIYMVSSFVNVAVPVILMPIMTRYMSPEDYGIIAMFQILVGIIMPITALGLQDAINRKYFEGDRIDFPEYITNCLVAFLGSSSVVLIVILLFSSQISTLSSFPEAWLWTSVLYSVSQFVISLVLNLWQVQFESIKYSIYQNLQTIINMAISLYFIVILDLKWQGRIEAQIIVAVLFAIIGIFILNNEKRMKIKINLKYMTDALRFGVPLVPHAFGGFIITMIDRVFITQFVGIAETGIYTVASQIGMVIALIEGAVGTAWSPWLFRHLADDTENKGHAKMVKFTYIYFAILLLFACSWAWFAPWLLGFFIGPKFYGAVNFVVWIALGNAFGGMFRIVALFIVFAGKTHILAWITLITSILYVGLSYSLISFKGVLGAAQAFMLIKLIFFLLTWILSNRVYKMPWLNFIR